MSKAFFSASIHAAEKLLSAACSEGWLLFSCCASSKLRLCLQAEDEDSVRLMQT